MNKCLSIAFLLAFATPAPAQSPTPLTRILEKGKEQRSTAILIVQDSKMLAEEYFGSDPKRASMAMSVTKSIVALAIGAMVDRGQLALDEPLSKRLFPVWKNTDKAGVTLRHLMNHSSGLDPKRAMPPGFTIEERALRSKLISEPGKRWRYNNNAADFLATVVRKAHPEGLYLDDYLDQGLFSELDIAGAYWMKDAKGDPRAAGELSIRPADLLKLGQLVLDKGRYKGEQLLSAAWIEQMLADGKTGYDRTGLLWWRRGRAKEVQLSPRRLQAWTKAGVAPPIVRAASTLKATFASFKGAEEALQKKLSPARFQKLETQLEAARTSMFDAKTEVLAYCADGYLGQYIVIIPSKRLVAVRMRDGRLSGWDNKKYNYHDFAYDVMALAGYDIPKMERR